MKFLVPLDGSKRAMGALPVARQLVDENDEVLLLTVGDAPDSVPHARELRAELGRTLDHAASALPGAQVETRVELTGDPDDTIAHVAKAEAVDLIIMTTTCSSGIARLGRRSIPDAVLRRARIPVTLVPVPAADGGG